MPANAAPLLPRRAALGLAATAMAAPALGQGKFPDRPIRFLIPWPPGGSLDALHGQMCEIVGRDLGQSVVLENRPG
ncbi:MAG: tripartite tricarboxylate transporter substrate binding protein, partial [Acetobacteraceae bacterium]|nr:tripartite tricarboxylate transporter substrate binding protein [Acetobacteraceae bacterium]